jgi:predicted permease
MVLREARRLLQRSPILSLSAIAVLALGIGASGLALALLLAFSSLTYPGMRALGYATIAEQTAGGGSMPISWQHFEKLRAAPEQNVSQAAYSRQISTTIEIDGKSRPLKLAAISRGFFSVFTPRLSAGRDFTPEEENQAGTHVVILSLPLAVSLFQSPDAAVNRFVTMDGLSFRVVGVAPESFQGLFGHSVAAWVPASCVLPLVMKLPAWLIKAKPDAWKELAIFYGLAASNQVSSAELVRQLRSSLPLRGATLHVSKGLTTDPIRDARLRKWLRLGLLLALVFTIVSALNYSLLLLARTPRYAEEVRLKKALGAGSGRLVIELMVGPGLTGAAGLVAATLLWAGGLLLVSRVSPFYAQLVRGSWRTALLAFGIQVPLACVLTLLIVLIPAFGLIRDDAVPRLGYGSTATRRAGSLLQTVVTLQIASCISTWILAGMIVAAVTAVVSQPLGYDASDLNVVAVGPGPNGVTFAVPAHGISPALSGLLDQVGALPGVRAACSASDAPFDSAMQTLEVEPMNGGSAAPVTVNQTSVTPGYFRTMGNRILRGRAFSWQEESENEAVINQAMARELWPDVNSVGRSLKLLYPAFKTSSVATIVGVVEDMRFSGYAESPEPTVFLPFRGGGGGFALIANGAESLRSLQDVVSRQVAAQMPGLVVRYSYRMEDRALASLWKVEKRAYFALAGALLMALVAYIGLYGALAYYVDSRRRELAVRTCLGAMPSSIRKIVVVRAARCALLAVALSAPLWVMLARLTSSDYLGEVSWSTSRAIFLSLACVAVAIFIALIPAIAATNISPAQELKEQ